MSITAMITSKLSMEGRLLRKVPKKKIKVGKNLIQV